MLPENPELSESSAAIVRATLPVVLDNGVAITSAFYDSLFATHPELLSLFNLGNQANGEQRRALAASVAAYAQHLVGEGDLPLDHVVARIAHKHASLGVRPEQYTVVGTHLMKAVAEVLGDAVTPEVAAAWEEVYWLFAVRLVAAESALYTHAGVDPRRPWSNWAVADRRDETDEVVSLVVVPEEGDVPDFLPGQYVTVNVELPDHRTQPRQYTISCAPGRGHLRLTLRAVPAGVGTPAGMVSSHLAGAVKVGDTLALSAPAGDVVLPPGDGPLVLISAGIGITPAAAMVDHLARTGSRRPVVAAHADRSPATHALAADVAAAGAQLPGFTQLLWYEDLPDADQVVAQEGARVARGLLDVDALPLAEGAEVHACGPLGFLRAVRAGLRARGVPAERLHLEVFGPDLLSEEPATPAAAG